jgi:hypothetical protein
MMSKVAYICRQWFSRLNISPPRPYIGIGVCHDWSVPCVWGLDWRGGLRRTATGQENTDEEQTEAEMKKYRTHVLVLELLAAVCLVPKGG